ncbi:hypothetical protein BGZ65_007784 [Modicella reniformis]|uniref:Uncharacterized protein n=1 Tax=Modicella reniformis TaxID=1440133 RepID=A0A9P6LRY1_9FUNG|nr:hypothetical protein BGZ65_007784 [Modicella reniformis]
MTVDISMMMDEGVGEVVKTPIKMLDHQLASAGELSNAKVLNIRQRKWNSVSKEWQEWQEVQATHTPDIPPSVHINQMHVVNSGSPRPNGAGNNGKAVSFEATAMAHSHSSDSLGHQRPFYESEKKFKLKASEHLTHDQRSAIGARARSLSETNIYPYTYHHHQQQQQQPQDDPYVLIDSHAQSESSSALYLMSSSRRTSITIAQLESLRQEQQHPDHLRHFGHPGRHLSDNIYSYHTDHWAQSDDNEAGQSRHTQGARFGQSSSGAASSQYPWTALSLDGTMNIPLSDQFSEMVPNSSSSSALSSLLSPTAQLTSSSSSISSSTGPSSHGYRLEEQSTWNQQLLKSQNAYRENNYEVSRHGYGGRSNSPHHYPSPHQQQQQHPYHHLPHGGHEDISMSEEIPRLMPSRSSSPAPCLSMAPTVTRPLSISFSQLTGPNMLGNLSEHEQDDDMEL